MSAPYNKHGRACQGLGAFQQTWQQSFLLATNMVTELSHCNRHGNRAFSLQHTWHQSFPGVGALQQTFQQTFSLQQTWQQSFILATDMATELCPCYKHDNRAFSNATEMATELSQARCLANRHDNRAFPGFRHLATDMATEHPSMTLKILGGQRNPTI